jgi:putative membrane protein
MPPQPSVDHRFLLANERTFLAYVRTAISLQVAGLAVLQFLTTGQTGLRVTLGLLLVAVGSYVALAGFGRFRANERSIRAGEELHAARATAPVTIAVVAIPLIAAFLLAVL